MSVVVNLINANLVHKQLSCRWHFSQLVAAIHWIFGHNSTFFTVLHWLSQLEGSLTHCPLVPQFAHHEQT